uniref:F-box domain-containing protein n=1 Tax=Anopheles atroparvus TaxID=41427 RepID=A0A182J7C5_ANOAO
MEETHQQPLRSSFPPAGTALFNASGGSAGGSSFGQDSGYTSYHSTTPNNTFNLSSRHGASATLATIDEASEGDCSMNDSAGSSALGGGVCSNILTPKTAASIDQISNFHLTTPNSAVRPKRPIRRRFNFDCASETGGSFVAPTTPERLPPSRSASFDSSDTPLRTVNRSSQQSQLTPHKAKGGHSAKRKLSSLRGKLYSDDGEGEPMAGPEDACDENRANDLNDSLDCKRLDISPIPKVKRHKPNENITNLIRSSTPKTASSQPRFLGGSTENIDSNTVAPGAQNVAPVRKTFRKFQSFSPSKMQSNRQKSSLRPRQEDRGWQQGNRLEGRTAGFGLTRQDPLAELELTPEKKTNPLGYVTPSKEQRVLTEIHLTPTKTVDYQPPMNLAGLINAPIMLEDPITTAVTQQLPERDDQLEQAITTCPTFEDFSMTPSKANLIDPELSSGDGGMLFAAEDFVARRASNFSYGPTLNSIIEEESPSRGREIGLVGKLIPTARTPPSSCRLSSGRKPKRLGTNSTSSGSLKAASPLAKGVRGVPASPKAAALRRANATLQNPPGMYCGRDQLNVLKRLYERNQDSLHILLDYLTDEDLVQVVQVSKGWREIIQDLPKQWERLQKFRKLQRGDKENQQQRRSSLAILPPLLKAGELPSGGFDVAAPAAKSIAAEGQLPAAATQADESSCVVKRRPFKICNSLDSSIGIGNCSSSMASGSAVLYASFGSECGNATMPERRRRLSAAAAAPHSPPVSPSKVKFVNNQKEDQHRFVEQQDAQQLALLHGPGHALAVVVAPLLVGQVLQPERIDNGRLARVRFGRHDVVEHVQADNALSRTPDVDDAVQLLAVRRQLRPVGDDLRRHQLAVPPNLLIATAGAPRVVPLCFVGGGALENNFLLFDHQIAAASFGIATRRLAAFPAAGTGCIPLVVELHRVVQVTVGAAAFALPDVEYRGEKAPPQLVLRQMLLLRRQVVAEARIEQQIDEALLQMALAKIAHRFGVGRQKLGRHLVLQALMIEDVLERLLLANRGQEFDGVI